MNKLTLLVLTAMVAVATTGVAANESKAQAQPTVYQEAYALYVLKNPNNKAQSSQALVQQFNQDYAELFKQSKKVNAEQFVAYEQQQLKNLMQQRREMSLKQTHVRYGILDADKNQKLTLKEFQDVGLKGFNEYDKNNDGVVNAEDLKLVDQKETKTHDGFSVRLPISMPMANNPTEFIRLYGQGKPYATLGDYLTGRDKQYFATDSNQDFVVSEKEYVDEFMQRYDRNTEQGLEKMKDLSARKFAAIANGSSTIQAKDVTKFAQKLDRAISQ